MADLIPIDAEPASADVIDTLKRALTLAEAGELSSVCVCYVYRDGSTGHRRSGLPSYSAMLGSLARMMHKLNLDLDAD